MKLLIVLEGPDGAGKTTTVQRLPEALHRAGIAKEVQARREPGGTPVGELLRGMLKDPQLELGAFSILHLFYAARAALIQQVLVPFFEQGDDRAVILDRSMWSTLVYNLLPAGAHFNRHELAMLREWQLVHEEMLRMLPEDVTLVPILLTATSSLDRRAGEAGRGVDRFESAGRAIIRRRQRVYSALWELHENNRILTDSYSPERVTDLVMQRIGWTVARQPNRIPPWRAVPEINTSTNALAALIQTACRVVP